MATPVPLTVWAAAAGACCAVWARPGGAAAGRVRSVRWGPRTLDVDVLWMDGVEALGAPTLIKSLQPCDS